MLVKIWTKSYGPNYTKVWAFWQKKTGFYNIFDKELTPFFWRCYYLIILMLNY